MALSHLGISREVAIDTENSAEANACRRFFDIARDASLQEFPWPFATKIDDLSLVEEDPNEEWGYSYRYPSDCFNLRRILSGTRIDTKDTRIPYRISKDSTGKLIFTDLEEAQAEWTVRITDAAEFSPTFALALSFRLAVYIAPRLMAGNSSKRQQELMQLYMMHGEKAADLAANEEQPDIPPESEFITGR